MTGLRPDFVFGWDAHNCEFILWRTGRDNPVARIPYKNGLSLAETVIHVASQMTNDAPEVRR